MKKVLKIIILFLCVQLSAQHGEFIKDSTQLRKIYTAALSEGKSYDWLNYLSNKIGARLAGSEGDKKAVIWGLSELNKLNLDYYQTLSNPYNMRYAMP